MANVNVVGATVRRQWKGGTQVMKPLSAAIRMTTNELMRNATLR